MMRPRNQRYYTLQKNRRSVLPRSNVSSSLLRRLMKETAVLYQNAPFVSHNDRIEFPVFPKLQKKCGQLHSIPNNVFYSLNNMHHQITKMTRSCISWINKYFNRVIQQTLTIYTESGRPVQVRSAWYLEIEPCVIKASTAWQIRNWTYKEDWLEWMKHWVTKFLWSPLSFVQSRCEAFLTTTRHVGKIAK